MAENRNNPTSQLQIRQAELEKKMGDQNPFHGAVARVYNDLGGDDFLKEWAEEYPSDFFRMMAKMAPAPDAHRMAPNAQIHLHLPDGLGPSPLDVVGGETLEPVKDE
jgi:hypothetical protein